ncbi:uncharacterized protein LOC111321147 [Stylophora pistillata]|uniref:uncharacterized protein LOC111321147 n=1 Tax=Stylophora pistillata TaxID=50429 RepID=UPI000C03B651|nr:uncharacterized protein LOC111321147 [Stylophora pistillata]
MPTIYAELYFKEKSAGSNPNCVSKTYTGPNGELKATAKCTQIDIAHFAKDIKILLENNAKVNNDFPDATIEVYFLWLFARRLVREQNPSTRKQEFDVLPIGSAIAGILKCLSLGKPETGRFEDDFLLREKFHVFTGTRKDRGKAIDEINKPFPEIFKRESTGEYGTEITYHLWERVETFCSEKSREAILVKQLQDLMNENEEHTWIEALFDAESSSSEDHFAKDSQK